MRTLFIFRDSYEARYILNVLDKTGLVDIIVIEKGVKAKERKLKRLFEKTNIFHIPLLLIDILALYIYSKVTMLEMKKKLGAYEYPLNKIKLTVDDANDKACFDFIKRRRPQIIFIYGTSILKKEFLGRIKIPILNIHSGILPKYRNVHSDFWAFLNKDFNNIGVSIIYLDSGIDNGDLAVQRRIKYSKSDVLVDIKIKILNLIPTVVKFTLKKINEGELPRKKQNELKKGFFYTPRLTDFIKLYVHN